MNNTYFSFFRFFLLWIPFALSVQAQTNNTVEDKLLERLNSLSKEEVSESIYLQTSKGIYETEEDVWFKAYVLNSQSLIPSALDKTLYVELIHQESNTTVWQEKYEIENGFVYGHLYLQDSLLTGVYVLEAYSPHSIDKSTKEYYAVRKLEILKKIALKRKPVATNKDSIIDFETFPEGGNLISGMRNKLAFKGVNSSGEPIFVSGTLFENDVALLQFNSVHAGMGSLDFTPDINKRYHIELLEPIKNKLYPLPQIKRGGITLRLIETTKEFLIFEITQNAKFPKGIIYFRLQSRGVVYSTATAELKNNLKIKVPLKDLPQGIAEATLYNNNLVPICERLVYVNQDRKLNIQALVSDEFNMREKASLKIKVTDQNKKPVVAHLGLSIYDKIYQNVLDPKNIRTHYNLSTQLNGRIFNPSYYFNENNKNRHEALDLLLLTQGWRKFVWNETNLNKNEDIHKILISDSIKGMVKAQKKRSKQPFEPPTLMAYVPDKKELFDFIDVDSLGQFTMTPKHLKMGEGGYVYLRMFTSNETKLHFGLKDFYFKTINSFRESIQLNYPLPNLILVEKDTMVHYIPASDVTQLDEVLIKTKIKLNRDKYLGKLDSIVRLEIIDYIAKPCGTLNCPFHPYEPGFKLAIEGEVYSRYVSTITVNGKSEEILEKVNYRKPKITDEYLMSRFNLIRTKGYYGKKEFYEPKYDQESMDDSFPDYRNTLLWNPSIITDENGEATIEFYCSDLNTKFIGTIEGVSGEGLLGCDSFEFVVKK